VTNPTPEQQATIDQHNKEYHEQAPRIMAHYYREEKQVADQKTAEQGKTT